MFDFIGAVTTAENAMSALEYLGIGEQQQNTSKARLSISHVYYAIKYINKIYQKKSII